MNLIVAVDSNWAIGFNNELLVKIPQDQKNFYEETREKVVIMGRKTLDSFPNGLPLKDRTNIVLTKNTNLQVKNTLLVHSLEKLLVELKKYNSENVYVIGGESIYRLLLPYCDTALVTKIFHSFDADTYFPDLDEMNEWKIVADSKKQAYFDLEYLFIKYKKIRKNQMCL